MTNKEFYGDKLLAIALDIGCKALHELAFGEPCVPKPCSYCELGDVDKIMAWLNAEHVDKEPPLLENGDDLKPGDWMVEGE